MHHSRLSRWPVAATICFLGLVVCAVPVSAATIKYYVTEDAYIDNPSPAVNFGDRNNLRVFSNSNNPEPCRTLVALPAAIGAINAADVLSGKLWVYNYGFSALTRDMHLHPLTRSFTEMGATWNTYDGTNAWTTPGGAYTAEFVSIDPGPPQPGEEAWFSFDITSMLTGSHRDNLLDYGVLLKIENDFTAPDSTTGRSFVSSDNTTYWDTQPYFEITMVPEPGAFLMLLTGGVLAAGAMRRRRRYSAAGE